MSVSGKAKVLSHDGLQPGRLEPGKFEPITVDNKEMLPVYLPPGMPRWAR